MESVFISGSRSIKALAQGVKDVLDKIIENQLTVLIGDCYGIDALVQQYLSQKGYKDVWVYHISSNPRNCQPEFSKKKVQGFRQVDKDIAMTNDCSYYLAIWDGVSGGTLNNIKRCKSLYKKGKVLC